jgi:hypothetical protein
MELMHFMILQGNGNCWALCTLFLLGDDKCMYFLMFTIQEDWPWGCSVYALRP